MYDACVALPTLTDEEKAQIEAWLIEAREFAVDAESSNKKHEAFGKYKGRKPVTVDKLEFAKWYAEVQSGGRTARFAMQQMGLKPNTWYKLCKEYETRTGRFKES